MAVRTASAHESTIPLRDPGFGATLQSEWTKLRSVRSTWIMLALGLGLSIGFSTLIAFVQGITWDDWSEVEQAAFDPVLYSMSGIIFLLIILIVFAVITVSSEYGSGLIRTTFLITPKRFRVFAAKLILVAIFGTFLSVVSFLGMFLISQTIYSNYGLETASLGDSDALRMLAFTPVTGAVYTMIPFALAFLLRGTAGAITAAVAFFFAPWILSALLPRWFQENVIRYLPDFAADSLAGVIEADASTYLSTGPAVVTVIAWLVIPLAVAAIMLNRWDA
jgi:ABC-2 type transport system permease protein